jgi:tripartite-type tricarboxylate transporter receptor subunit TctC
VNALQSADVRQQLTALGLEPVGNTPAQFGATIKAEIAQWGEVVKRAGIKAD